MFLDQLNRTMEMRSGLYMNGEIVRPSLGKLGDKGIGVCDHEVDVERQFGDLSERCDDRRTDGQIWDEMSIHHIDVQKVGSRTFHSCYFIGQSGKVGS